MLLIEISENIEILPTFPEMDVFLLWLKYGFAEAIEGGIFLVYYVKNYFWYLLRETSGLCWIYQKMLILMYEVAEEMDMFFTISWATIMTKTVVFSYLLKLFYEIKETLVGLVLQHNGMCFIPFLLQ